LQCRNGLFEDIELSKQGLVFLPIGAVHGKKKDRDNGKRLGTMEKKKKRPEIFQGRPSQNELDERSRWASAEGWSGEK